MKSKEVKFDEEGFEEIPSDGGTDVASGTSTGNSSSGANRPDLRIVQTDRDREGNVVYSNVGGMWKNISKNGNVFYTLKIGQMKLLVFPNDKK